MPVLTLFDWKTSGFLAPEHLIQLGAYQDMDRVLEDGRWEPITPECRAQQAAIVQVREGTCKVAKLLTEHDLVGVRTFFQQAVEQFHWLRTNGFIWDVKRTYQVEGREYVSVTEILSHVCAKPGLLNWSYEGGLVAGLQARLVGCTEAEVAAAVAVKAELEAKRLRKTDPAAQPWLKVVGKLHEAGLSTEAKRDGRAGQGTTVHKNILYLLEGRAVELGSAPEWLRDDVLAFERWSRKVQLNPMWTERKVCHDTLGVAGTVDCLAWSTAGATAKEVVAA